MSNFFKKFTSKEEEKEEPPKRSFKFLSFSRLSTEPKPDLEKGSIKQVTSDMVKQVNKHGKVVDNFIKKHVDIGRNFTLSVVFFLIACGLFTLSFFMIDIIVLVPYKFAMIFTLGSFCLLTSISFLSGPYSFCKKLFRKQRIVFTLSYFGALFCTFFFSTIQKKVILLLISCGWQIVAMLFFLVSTVPGGTFGLKIICRLVVGTIERCLKHALRI